MLDIRTGIKKFLAAVAVVFAIAWFQQQWHLYATTRTVCASGCTYTNSQLQQAIDDAVAGDTILLQQNFSYVATSVPFKLRQKSCAANNSSCYITIKTGVTSTGAIMSSSLFPAANIRISPSYSNVLAKITQGTSPTIAAVRTVKPSETGAGTGCTVAPCVANWWKLALLEVRVDSASVGQASTGDLIQLGTQDAGEQDSRSKIPSHFILDQMYIHGDDLRGGLRGIDLFANDTTITNSYLGSFMNITKDGQAIYINNAEGPFTIVNNFIENSSQTFMSGGDVPIVWRTQTVAASPAPTTTTFALDSVDQAVVGEGIACHVATTGVTQNLSTITNITGTTVTVSPAFPTGPPLVGNTCSWGLVPKNLTFQKNYVQKRLVWRNPIVDTVTGVSATATNTGGTLAAGTYFYKVQARRDVAGGTARSTSSSEVSATIPAGVTTGSITITWNAGTSNADQYRVYGRSSGGENIYFTVNAPTTSYTDTGSAGTSGAVPTTTGTTWLEKNLFELKNMDTALVEGNIFEGAWKSGQSGYGILFTPLNSGGSSGSTDPSSVVKNITFRKNIVRKVAGFMQITGHDASSSTQISMRAQNITVSDNLLYDAGSAYGTTTTPSIIVASAGDPASAPREGPKDVVIDHNTYLVSNENMFLNIALAAGGVDYFVENFTFRNNIIRRGNYGLRYTKSPGGIQTEGSVSWDLSVGTSTTKIFEKNVISGATCSLYTDSVNQFCPSEATLQSNFVNYANNDYRLAGTSAWKLAGTDGKDIGADINAITALTTIAQSGDNTGVTPPAQVPPNITTVSLPDGTVGTAYPTTTLAATDCTSTCSWSITSGTLPTGLTLTSAGVLSGTPTLAGAFTITIRAIASTTQLTDSQVYSFNIVESPPPPPPGPPRPVRMDYVENATFVRPDEPTITDDSVRTGDVWVDLTNNLVKWLVTTSPSSVWYTFLTDQSNLDSTKLTTGIDASKITTGTMPIARLGATGSPSSTTFLKYDGTTLSYATPPGSGGITIQNLMFHTADNAYVTWTVTGGITDEMFGAARNRLAYDLTGFTQCRFYVRQSAALAGVTGIVYPQYSTDGGSVWNDLGTTAQTPSIDATTTVSGLKISSWTNIVSGAKAEITLRVVINTGAGTVTTSPSFGNIGMNCK